MSDLTGFLRLVAHVAAIMAWVLLALMMMVFPLLVAWSATGIVTRMGVAPDWWLWFAMTIAILCGWVVLVAITPSLVGHVHALLYAGPVTRYSLMIGWDVYRILNATNGAPVLVTLYVGEDGKTYYVARHAPSVTATTEPTKRDLVLV